MQYVCAGHPLDGGIGARRSSSQGCLARIGDGTISRLVMSTIIIAGIGLMAWDVVHPYKLYPDRTSRDFARQFWKEESAGAELICAKTDLRLPLDTVTWQGNRAASYLCYQKIYCDRLRAKKLPRYDLISESRPLRLVVFHETPGDRSIVSEWIAKHGDRFELCGRRERSVNDGVVLGSLKFEDRYVVYELAPRRLAMQPRDTQR